MCYKIVKPARIVKIHEINVWFGPDKIDVLLARAMRLGVPNVGAWRLLSDSEWHKPSSRHLEGFQAVASQLDGVP